MACRASISRKGWTDPDGFTRLAGRQGNSRLQELKVSETEGSAKRALHSAGCPRKRQSALAPRAGASAPALLLLVAADAAVYGAASAACAFAGVLSGPAAQV